MKICLFADAQSVHIKQLAHHLLARGHQIHVVTHKPATLQGATVERFAVPPPGISNFRGWKGRRRRYLLDLFKEFDVVNIHFLADWGLTEFLTELGPGHASVIATAWGSDIVDPPGETPASTELIRARKHLLRSADAITTCGRTFARTVSEYADIPTSSIHVVPLGVDLSKFQRDGGDNRADDQARIGFFKGFRAVYGPAVLMRAIPKVLAQFPKAKFEMIGDGPELKRCQAMAIKLNVDPVVEWVGRLDHAQLPHRLRRWQLSVIPSIHEAFGVAALESQAMQVPVIASAVDGLHDTVHHDETGLLFPVGDSDALADGIIRLLGDRTLLTRMGRAGSEAVAREYDWTTIAVQWEQLYLRTRERSFRIHALDSLKREQVSVLTGR